MKEVTITSITAAIVWPQTELQPHPLAENWIKDLLSMALPTRARPSFTRSQSLPPGCFHKPLILNNQRAERMKATIKENETNWSYGSKPCLTQRNNEPCHVGLPKTHRSWWRVLTNRGPLEKGMSSDFSSLALRAPWKDKKIWHWNMNSPGQ